VVVDGGFPVTPFTPLAMVGDAVVDRVDCVAGVTGPHADAKETLAMPMKAATTALRAAVAIRELTMALIKSVNHRAASSTQKTGRHHQTLSGREYRTTTQSGAAPWR
jgi:hypothetical protein